MSLANFLSKSHVACLTVLHLACQSLCSFLFPSFGFDFHLKWSLPLTPLFHSLRYSPFILYGSFLAWFLLFFSIYGMHLHRVSNMKFAIIYPALVSFFKALSKELLTFSVISATWAWFCSICLCFSSTTFPSLQNLTQMPLPLLPFCIGHRPSWFLLLQHLIVDHDLPMYALRLPP